MTSIGGVSSTEHHSPLNIVVLVSGSGTLLQSILDNQDEHYRVSRVVADTACPALERARGVGIPTDIVALDGDRHAWNIRLAEAVALGEPDLVVSAGFMKILGKGFLHRYQGRIINTHPALLPSFPGAHGVRDALRYGVKVTGSTVHLVDEGVDTGPIIAQEAVAVLPDDTEDVLHERIKKVERRLIVSILRRAHVDGRTGEVHFKND
ncbi:phosphoribosylglycinamide formyltransferase [Corynebacterium uropygiale]|uniref:Phosphoribosylglycinamide formyltransferase n=1 Tax=Corynebacterium uropygiale TaxID=1775911 RepID=A0A9X1QSI8_9CORY|nr:phosphoribosylglycinamide formyltransferase [Corynebacterium uropygiale]